MKKSKKKEASQLGALFAFVLCFGFGCCDGGCSGAPTSRVEDSSLTHSGADEGSIALPNPASAHCVERGHRLVLREGPGGQFGVCLFEDGSACEEWRYFKGKCGPGTCRDTDGLCD